MDGNQYVLTRLALGEQIEVEIDEREYHSIVTACDVVLAANEIEDVFGNLIDNYIEFEQEVVTIAVRESIVSEPPKRIFEHMQTLSRRLANVLGSARSYRDQGHKLMKKIGSAEGADAFERLLNQQYDRCFGYRLMEALRDHGQHVSQPVTGISLNRYRNKEDLFVFGIRIRVGRDDLLENIKLKSSFRKELEADGSKGYELRPALRQYMAGLCAAHEELRKHHFQRVTEGIAVIEAAWARFQSSGEQDLIGVGVVERTGTETKTVHLSTNMVTILRKKQSLNSGFVNLDRRFATGHAPLDVGIKG